MLAAVKYIKFIKYIKEMGSISFYPSILATALIICFLYTHLFDFYLIENNYLLLTFFSIRSTIFLKNRRPTKKNTIFSKNGIWAPPLGGGGIFFLDKPKLKRLTKDEQKQYVIPSNLKQILVG